MEQKEWLAFLQKESEIPFEGWNFSYLTKTGRMHEAPLSWNYSSIVRNSIKGAQSLLDMGTGGGELLSCLQPLPPQTIATEGYAPNVPVARARLEPLGVTVVEADGEDRLPFGDHVFDIIINRHESYVPEEIHRLLKPGGLFITQQVGGQDSLQLNRLLDAAISDQYVHWNLAYAAEQLEHAGFVVSEKREELGFTRFFDVGAIVYYLKAIVWQIPDFSIERYADQLLRLHQWIEAEGYVDIPTHRFFVAAKPI